MGRIAATGLGGAPEDAHRLTQSAKLSATRQLGNSPSGFTFSIKKPFDGEDKKLQVNFVTTYYFR